jgi:DNA-binding response OmpR family regulator
MKVLIVEDDLVLGDVLVFTLQRAGFEVVKLADGLQAAERWVRVAPDILLLDVNLPGMDGFALCAHIRKQSDVPIILLTVKDSDRDVIDGLEIGADDYMTKPFSPVQLIARIQAILRRVQANQQVTQEELETNTYSLRLLPSFHQAQLKNGETIVLTRLEYKLLEVLHRNAGQVLTSELLIDRIWGQVHLADRTALKQLVYRLRRKIELSEDTPPRIETIPGVGYSLVL